VLSLMVKDDGKGCDVAAKSLGLGIMHERAGAVCASLDIQSRINGGTEVTSVWRRSPEEA
jgi:signal transduction histidine kinase